MNPFFPLAAVVGMFLAVPAQAQTITKQAPTTIASSGKTMSVGPQLPDLKFSDMRVVATPVQSNGAVNYDLNVTFTVTNSGTASVVLDDITIQAFYTNEANYPRIQDLSFTSYFQPAGGKVLCRRCGTGETLAPGASVNGIFTPFNVPLAKTPRPVYLLIINPFGGPNESDKTNNRAYMTILL